MKIIWALVLLGGLQDPAKPVQSREEIFKQDVENAIQKLGSEKYTESYVAREDLVEIGRRAVPAVVAELNKKDLKPAVKRSLCEVLERVHEPDKDAVAALLERLKDKDEYGTSIASAAARALIAIVDDACIPGLLEALKSKRINYDRILKYECIRGLGVLRVKEGTELLRKALEDKKAASVSDDDQDAHLIAAAAAHSLALLRASEAVEDLGKLLSDTDRDPASGQTLGVLAARALQRILGPEFAGKTEKDEPRLGSLTGEAAEISKTHEAWKKWWGEKEGKKKVEETRATMGKIVAGIEIFKREQGRYPDVLAYLKEKPTDAKNFPKEGYYPGDLKDAWGNMLFYKSPGTGTDFDLVSFGKDGKPWGSGLDADVWSHDKWLDAKKTETKKAIEDAVKVINQFKADQGRYPEKLLDLMAKPQNYPTNNYPAKGYVERLPRDAFDNTLFYRVPGTGGEPFDLISYGADRVEGGTGADEDLWNHDKRAPVKDDKEKKDDKK